MGKFASVLLERHKPQPINPEKHWAHPQLSRPCRAWCGSQKRSVGHTKKWESLRQLLWELAWSTVP